MQQGMQQPALLQHGMQTGMQQAPFVGGGGAGMFNPMISGCYGYGYGMGMSLDPFAAWCARPWTHSLLHVKGLPVQSCSSASTAVSSATAT
jgi:hypothetical protein